MDKIFSIKVYLKKNQLVHIWFNIYIEYPLKYLIFYKLNIIYNFYYFIIKFI